MLAMGPELPWFMGMVFPPELPEPAAHPARPSEAARAAAMVRVLRFVFIFGVSFREVM
jgi:hypothetical protein